MNQHQNRHLALIRAPSIKVAVLSYLRGVNAGDQFWQFVCCDAQGDPYQVVLDPSPEQTQQVTSSLRARSSCTNLHGIRFLASTHTVKLLPKLL